MLRFNKEQREAWNALFKTEQGKVCLEYLKEYLFRVKLSPNSPADGIAIALYQSAVSGEFDFIQHLIETSKEDKKK